MDSARDLSPRSAREYVSPRSISSSTNTPRDDRFYTPRTYSNNNESSDEWVTPRPGVYSPRQTGYNSEEFGTPRSIGGTPRMGSIDDNSSAAARKYISNSLYQNEVQYKYYDQESNYRQQQQQQQQQQHHQYSHEEYAYYRQPPQQQQQQQQQQVYYQSDEYSSYKQDYDHTVINENTVDYHQAEGKYNNDYYDETIDNNGISEQEVENIFRYARHGRVDEIERLINRGIPIDVRDEHGNTLLIIASQNGNKRVAKLCLRYGCNINGRNHKGNTPLHYCFHFGYGDSLGEYLISKGADSNMRNNAGKVVFDGI